MCWRHSGWEPGYAVEAERPFWRVGRGGDVRGPGLAIGAAKAAEEGPEFLLVGEDVGFVCRGGGGMDDDETGVGA